MTSAPVSSKRYLLAGLLAATLVASAGFLAGVPASGDGGRLDAGPVNVEASGSLLASQSSFASWLWGSLSAAFSGEDAAAPHADDFEGEPGASLEDERLGVLIEGWVERAEDPDTLREAFVDHGDKMASSLLLSGESLFPDDTLRVIVSVEDRPPEIESFVEANTEWSHWFGDRPAFVAHLLQDDLAALLEDPGVVFVEPDVPIELASTSVEQINAKASSGGGMGDGVWAYEDGELVSTVPGLRDDQVTGSGVTVAVVDAGLDPTHTDFGGWDCEDDDDPGSELEEPCESRVVENVRLDHQAPSDTRETEDLLPTQDLGTGHGTHVAGVIAGNAKEDRNDGAHTPTFGVAPEANLVGVAFDHALGPCTWFCMDGNLQSHQGLWLSMGMDALSWVHEHRDAYSIHVVANGWACVHSTWAANPALGLTRPAANCQFDKGSAFNALASDLYDRGVISVFPGGNLGETADEWDLCGTWVFLGSAKVCHAFSGLAQSPYVLGVGAIDGQGEVPGWSSRVNESSGLAYSSEPEDRTFDEVPPADGWHPADEPTFNLDSGLCNSFNCVDVHGYLRPDVVAPGVEVPATAAQTGGATVSIAEAPTTDEGEGAGRCEGGVCLTEPRAAGAYAEHSGSSVAMAHVAGAVALLYDACHGVEPLEPLQAMRAIKAGAQPLAPDYEPWTVGYGALDVRASLDWLMDNEEVVCGHAENKRPSILKLSIQHEMPLEAGGTVEVDVRASDEDGNIAELEVDWGDGTGSTVEGSGHSDEHAYEEAGTYTITVTARDDEGAVDTDEHRVKVHAPFQASGPILIDGDDDALGLDVWALTPFVEEDEGTYRIQDLRIPTAGTVSAATTPLEAADGTDQAAAITIANTGSPLLIENVYIHAPTQEVKCPSSDGDDGETFCLGGDVGVRLENVEGMRLRNLTIQANGATPLATGINITGSEDVRVLDSVFEMGAHTESTPMPDPLLEGSWAIEARDSEEVILERLQVRSDTCASGIDLHGVAGARLASSVLRVGPADGCSSTEAIDAGAGIGLRISQGTGTGSAEGTEPIRVFNNVFDIPATGTSTPVNLTGEPQVSWTVQDGPTPSVQNIVGGPCLGGNHWGDHVWAGLDPKKRIEEGSCEGFLEGLVETEGIHDDLPLAVSALPPQGVSFEHVPLDEDDQRLDDGAYLDDPLVARPCNAEFCTADDETATFEGATAQAIDGTIVSWNWSYERNEAFGELVGEPSPETVTFQQTRIEDGWQPSFQEPGVYDVHLEAVVEAVRHDAPHENRAARAHTLATESVAVASNPTASFQINYHGGTTVPVDASDSSDGDGFAWAAGFDIVRYDWKVINEDDNETTLAEGCVPQGGNPPDCQTTTWQIPDSGTYTVHLKVTDRFGLQHTTSQGLVVDAEGVAPAIAILDEAESPQDTFETWEMIHLEDRSTGVGTVHRTISFEEGPSFTCENLAYTPGGTDDSAAQGDCGEIVTYAYETVQGEEDEFTVTITTSIDSGEETITRTAEEVLTVENRDPPAFQIVQTSATDSLLAASPDDLPDLAPSLGSIQELDAGVELHTKDEFAFWGPAAIDPNPGDPTHQDAPRGDVDGQIQVWEWSIYAPQQTDPTQQEDDLWIEYTICQPTLSEHVEDAWEDRCDEWRTLEDDHDLVLFDPNDALDRDGGTLNLRGGTYSVHLLTVDNGGSQADHAIDITVDWTPPEVRIHCSWTGQDGQEHQCTDNQATPTSLDEVRFNAAVDLWEEDNFFFLEWYVDGELELEEFATFPRLFDEVGTFQVTLLANTENGPDNETSVQVDVQNIPPTADFQVDPMRPVVDGEVRLTDESTDLDGEILAWHWDLGDGTTLSCPDDDACPQEDDAPLTHTYDAAGVHTISLTVTDDGETTDGKVRDILIEPPDPLAAFNIHPSNPETLEEITFTDISQSSGYSEIVQRSWDFGDGTTKSCTSPGPCDATHTYQTTGTYPVTLTIEDEEDRLDAVTQNLHIENQPPHVAANATPNPATIDDTIEFQADASVPDGTIEAWHWDLGDGTAATGPRIIHTYDAKGVYDVSLVVTDDVGATNETTFQVHVANQPPTVEIDYGSDDPDTGQEVSFHVDAHDPDGIVIDHAWAFDDGHRDQGERVDHAFDVPGTYNVTVAVTDDDGATATSWVLINVANRGPVAAFTTVPQAPAALEDVNFITESSDPDGELIAHEWDIETGPQETAPSTTHRFPEAGTYNVTLTVTDDDGATAQITEPITVTNAPPTASFTHEPDVPTTDTPIRFTPESTDPDGTIEAWHWDLDDGNTTDEPNPTHTFQTSGSYVVMLTVTDDDGANASTYQHVTVVPEGADIARQEQLIQEAPNPGALGLLLVLATALLITRLRRNAP